ncbi:MAG: acyl-CoA dehydrogenase family protein [Natrialbaceae archaeon]|nr:acyl-CoA dehydrogenase family protein [Natrialbaceae archaeon]
MMLTEEQELVRDTVREFMETEIAPDLPEADKKPMTHDEAVEYMQKMAEIGVGPAADDEDSLSGGDPRTGSLVAQEVSRVWPSLQVTLGMSSIVSMAHMLSDETTEAYAEEIEANELVGGIAITEPSGGSDTKVPGTTAVKDGDEYVLTGEKTWVSNAPIADMMMVVAWDDEYDQRDFFVVDQRNSPFETQKLDKLGWKGSPTGQLFLDETRIPIDNKVSRAVMNYVSEGGDVEGAGQAFGGGGGDPLNNIFASMRNGMSSIAVGIMQGAFDKALEYSTDRETFEKPIGQHQLIQEKLFDIKAKLEASRHLTYHVDDLIANGDPRARQFSSLAKGWVCERSVEATYDAQQVFGANGLSTDYPLERFYRDARTMTIPDGTTEIQKLIVGYELTDLQAYK